MRRRNSTYSSRIPYDNKSVRKLSIYDFAVVGIGFLSIRFRLFFVVSASEESRRGISGRAVVIASLSLLCRSLFLSASFVELYVSSQYSSEILSPDSAYCLCRSNLYYAAGLMKTAPTGYLFCVSAYCEHARYGGRFSENIVILSIFSASVNSSNGFHLSCRLNENAFGRKYAALPL